MVSSLCLSVPIMLRHFELPVRHSKHSTCYGNVAGWLCVHHTLVLNQNG